MDICLWLLIVALVIGAANVPLFFMVRKRQRRIDALKREIEELRREYWRRAR